MSACRQCKQSKELMARLYWEHGSNVAAMWILPSACECNKLLYGGKNRAFDYAVGRMPGSLAVRQWTILVTTVLNLGTWLVAIGDKGFCAGGHGCCQGRDRSVPSLCPAWQPRERQRRESSFFAPSHGAHHSFFTSPQ